MEHLTLLALSEDGTRLLLGSSAGVEYTLDVNNALRSAVRGEQPRPSHLETRMDSALRPRDIQARIRSGESAEAVAAAAGTPIEKIMPYAAPVLAERAHVADRAQKSSLRRRSPESGSTGARTLADAVETQMRSQNTDPNGVEWDAFRREDGRWTLTGLYETPNRTGVATFMFDVPGNYVTLVDDDARWLVGDLVDAPAAAEGDARRLSSVPSSLGDDAIELVHADQAPNATPVVDVPPASEPAAASVQPPAASIQAPAVPPLAEDRTIDLTETVNSIRSAIRRPAAADVTTTPTQPLTATAPVEASTQLDDSRVTQAPVAPAPEAPAPATEAPAGEQAAEEPAEEPAEEAAPAPKKPAKRRGRASVPSWDEIMFGGGND